MVSRSTSRKRTKRRSVKRSVKRSSCSPRRSATKRRSPPRKLVSLSESNCMEFFSNPRRNPETNRLIKRTSPIYKRLRKYCGSVPPGSFPLYSQASVCKSPRRRVSKLVANECVEFMARYDPVTKTTYNPLTGRLIKSSGRVYKQILRKCHGM